MYGMVRILSPLIIYIEYLTISTGVSSQLFYRVKFPGSNCFQEYDLWREATGEEWWLVARFDQIKKFVHHVCSISDDNHTNQLGQLQCLNVSLLFIETADTHPRVKAQQHVFAVATKPNRKIVDFLREKQVEMDEKGWDHQLNDKYIPEAIRNVSIYDGDKIYRRIIIPAGKTKKEFRGKLRSLGVNTSTIMPNLDGLGKWLTEYYKSESIGTVKDGNEVISDEVKGEQLECYQEPSWVQTWKQRNNL